MSVSTHTVLVTLVEMTGETDEPVPEATLAASLTLPESTLAESLESLQQFELVTSTEDGYRPTVTAHELLAADIELGDTLVVDVVEE